MNMKPAPKLSIVTVNLNQAAGLTQTFDSVRAQTFRDFEHIVVDGGSTDGSLEVIKARADGLAFWVSEPDAGIYAAMNKGLRQAKGEYVYFLNSGDWLAAPDVLERIFAQNAEPADMIYGDSLRPDGSGGWKILPQPDQWTLARFWGMGICHQTIFYRKTLFDKLGGYDEQFRIVADWDFNLRALWTGCSSRHVPYAVVCYPEGGISATRIADMEAEKKIMRRKRLPEAVYRDYERLMFLEAECRKLKSLKGWAASFPDILLNALAILKKKVGR